MEDDIALTRDGRFQARNVNFLSIFRALGLGNLRADGILGLSPRHSNEDRGVKGDIHLLVDQLA